MTDVETGRPVTRDSVFRIASITKNYTAALAMKLVEEGVLELGDTIDRWFPEVPPHLSGIREATFEQLLSHTSGLTQTYTRDEDRGRTLDRGELLDRIPEPRCDPGTCYLYADGNFLIAGLVIEGATGRSLDQELQDRILVPLRLDHTLTGSMAVGSSVIAPQYHLRQGPDDKPVEPIAYEETVLPRWESGGILATTAPDLAAWGHALFGGRFLEADGLARMLDTRLFEGQPCPEPCPFAYGLGVVHYEIAGRSLVGHDGSSGAVLAHDRNDGTTIAILTNGGEQDMGAFLTAVLHSIS